jgi:hypothetical protein
MYWTSFIPLAASHHKLGGECMGVPTENASNSEDALWLLIGSVQTSDTFADIFASLRCRETLTIQFKTFGLLAVAACIFEFCASLG